MFVMKYLNGSLESVASLHPFNGLARRADSATQSQFSVHFSTKTSDFFRSEFCDVLIRSGYEVVAKGPESVHLASPSVD